MRLRILTFLTLILQVFSTPSFSQNEESNKVNLNHYTLTFGLGWSHYIDNLDYGNQNIRKDFAGVSGKFFWEPEFLLSLGLETGYYKLFRVNFDLSPDTTIKVERQIVPMLLLARMRIISNVYLGVGMGLAFLTNIASGPGESITTKVTSLSNYEIFASYLHPLSNNWIVGGEFKTFHFGNMNDWVYSLQGTFAVRF